MRPCGGKRCPGLKKRKKLYFIIISNVSFTHYAIQPLSFSFPNFMAAHGVGVAQAKPACKHTIATRKCYQYNILIILLQCLKLLISRVIMLYDIVLLMFIGII